MEMTLAEAAVAVNMTKPGLLKAIKSGRLSAVKDANGTWKLDTAELFRVYAPANRKAETEPETPETEYAPAHTELAVTKAKLAAAEAMIDELKRSRDAWQAQAERLALTTTAGKASESPVQASEPARQGEVPDEAQKPRKRGFWRSLWGGGDDGR